MISPIVSFVSLIIYSFVLANSQHIYATHIVIVLFSILLIHRVYIKELLVLNLFVIIIAIPVGLNDINKAIVILLRANLIMLLSLQLFYKRDLYAIIKAFVALRLPNKFVAVSFLAIKSIQLLLIEIQKINTTLKARGFVAKSNMFTYKTYANMVAMLIIKSIHQSKQMQKMLVVRGFDDTIYLIDNSCYTIKDIIFVVLLIFSFTNIGLII